MILRRKWGLSIGEVWFDEAPVKASCDVLWHWQSPEKPGKGPCETKRTLKVDLSLPSEAILNAYTKETRYEIRRADTKDGLSYTLLPEPREPEIARFTAFYEVFARQKGLIIPSWNRTRSYASAGELALSLASQGERPLVWHAYYHGRTTARLLHSASLYRTEESSALRSLTGRGNRWLHWRDMMAFRERGLRFYDFGGWYAGQSDQDRLRINKFKEEFGAVVAVEYNYVEALTFKGGLALLLRNLRARLFSRQR